MSYAPPHFSWVTEHVAGFAFPALRENLDYLVNKAHITHLITLCREKPEHLEDFPSLHHHYYPVGGFTEDDLDLVKEIVDIMVNAESKNEKSGVHCQMGMVRTGTILAAYLANKNKVDGITATKQLGKLRRKSLVEGTDAEVVRLYAESLGESGDALGLPKWPCCLEQCVSPHWSPDDCVVEFWDVETGSESVRCSESLTFTSFQSLTSELKDLLEACLKHLPPNAPRLVSIIWEPNILTPVVVQGILRAGCAFAPSRHANHKEHLLQYRRYLATLIVLGPCTKELLEHFEKQANLPPASKCLPPDLLAQHSQLFRRPDFQLFVAAGRGDGEVPCWGDEIGPATRRLAYCMTTSGSTGHPKTVLVAHSCVTANVVDLAPRFSPPPPSSDGLLLTSPLTFDASIVQIYLALATHRRLVLPSSRILMGVNFSALASVCAAAKVGLWQCTPSLFRLFSQPDLLARAFSDRQVDILLGGEPCQLTRTQWPRRLRIHCLYGVTEVSAWSTFLTLDEDLLNAEMTAPPLPGATPIGYPMLYSDIAIKATGENPFVGEACLSRDQGGYAVAELGEDLSRAASRLSQQKSVAWSTGDSVVIAPETRSFCWFLGRQDRVVKVVGQKLHLERLEVALHRILDECLVEDGLRVIHCVCAMQGQSIRANAQLGVVDGDKLKASLAKKGASHEDLYASWRKASLSQLRSSFLPIFLPRKFTFSLDAFPLNSNGKLVIGKQRFSSPPHRRATIRNLCGLALNSALTTDAEEQKTFLELGGSSLSAMWLVESLITELDLPDERTTLLTALFSQPLAGFLSHVESLAEEVDKSVGSSKVQRLDHELATLPVLPLKDTKPASAAPTVNVSVAWRHLLGKCVDASPLVVVQPPSVASSPPEAVVFIGSHSGYFKALRHNNGDPLWSQLLSMGDQPRSRIEASACYFSPSEASEAFVAVGTLDGPVYALEASSGRLLWQADTGGAVKCPPTPLPELNLLLTGSHGRHLIALTVPGGRPAWSVCLDNSPLVAPVRTLSLEWQSEADSGDGKKTHTVIIAGSLAGGLHCVDAETGKRRWTVQHLGPIFSAPLLLPPDVAGQGWGAGIVIATADGRVHCVAAADGRIRWTQTPSPRLCQGGFFADPVLLPGEGRLALVASQSAHLYALRTEDGKVAWSVDLSVYERVNASASAFLTTPLILLPPGPLSQSHPVLLVCRTDGLFFSCEIEPERGPLGEISLMHRFPAEIFSAPAVFRPHAEGPFWVYVGCRDDHVYGLLINKPV